MANVRYLWKFGSYVWPEYNFEYQRQQPLRAPLATLGGSDFALDLLDGAPAIMDPARERVRFVHYGQPEDANAAIDDMLSSLYLGGLDDLWTRTNDPLDPPRYAKARLTDMPEITVSGSSYHVTPVVIGFTRLTHWLGETAFSASKTVTATSDSLVVNNPGNLPSKRVTIRLTSVTSAGLSNVKIVNDENGYEFESLRDSGGIGQVLELNTRVPSLTFQGVSDLANYVTPPVTQRYLSFVIMPGNNTLLITAAGTPNFLIEVEGDSTYA